MMYKMNSTHIFSIHRVGALMRRDLMENHKWYLKTIISLLIAMLLAFILKMNGYTTILYADEDGVAGSLFANSMGTIFYIIYTWVAMGLSALVLSNMKTKEQRINFLMVPATRIEKYLSRVLLLVVAPLFVLILVVLVADILHMFLSLFMGVPGVTDHWIFPAFLHRFSFSTLEYSALQYPVLAGLLSYMMFFWTQSLFVLGGCVFNKSPLLKTLGVLLLLFIAMGILGSSIALHHIEFFHDLYFHFDEWQGAHKWFSLDLAFSLASVLLFWFTVLNYWLGYRLFSRKQIIRPKLFGL
jgi:hypothetical protein